VVVDAGGDERLETLTLRTPDGVETLPADALFILIGAEPRTEWLPPEIERDERGFVSTKDDYATSVPGVFAIGDVRAGSVKRVASAVGEGSVVIQHVHHYLDEARLLTRP
jgi:thioredoxin reductase (NADPH)